MLEGRARRGWLAAALGAGLLAFACAGGGVPAPGASGTAEPAPPAAEPEPGDDAAVPIPDLPAPAPGPAPPERPGSPEAEPPEARGPFPAPEELDELGEAPAPEQVFALDVHPVERWRLAGPFPERVGALPWQGDDPWSKALAEAAERRAGLVLPTEAMHCVARELGLFYLAHRARPTDSLRRFITARCHASVASIGMAHYGATVPAGASEAQVFERWRETTGADLTRALSGGPRTVGLWYGRKGDQVVVMLAWGHREVLVEPVSPFADGEGRFVLEGETIMPAVRVQALVNHGRFDVAACEPAGEVAPPRFRFTCSVDPRDAQAFVSLSVLPPDRLLAKAGLNVLVWPGRSTSQDYRRPTYGPPRPVSTGDDVAEDFVALLNSARKEAGREPVELDAPQSATASRLAPFFFAALLRRQPEVQADVIVLGMLAGWRVQGTVEAGHVTSAWVARSTDLSELLGAALEYPVGRETLMAQDIQRIAVGGLLATDEGREGMAALVGTYSLFSGAAHAELADRVMEQLAAARAARGLAAPRKLHRLDSLCHDASVAVSAGEAADEVLNALLRGSVQIVRRPVSGWLAEVSDLSALEFDDLLLDEPDLAVAVSVSHRKEPGDAWGRYVVMLVLVSEGLGT